MQGNTIDLIVKLVIMILGFIFTYVIVPYFKNKVDQEKLDNLQSYVEYAVRYAEMVYKPENYKEKKAYVSDYILEKSNSLGLSLNEEDIDIIIEAVVNLVKYDGPKEG